MSDRRIINVLIVICVLFLSLIGYLTYIQLALADKISENPYNQRQWAYEADIDRGTIYDRKGVSLAYSEKGERIYPFNNMYSLVLGYNSQTYGKSMLEQDYNKILLGQYGIGGLNITGSKKSGYDLHLTIDHELQKTAYDLIGNRSGAAVAINPKTGEVLAMVSRPDFNPNPKQLAADWNTIVDDPKSPLLPRAVSGLYAPGSTFKIITSSAALDFGLENEIFDDNGKITIDGKVISNSGGKAHGKLTFERAFQLSSNVAFCELGTKIGFDKLKETAEAFGFNAEPDYDFTAAKSRFPLKETGKAETASLAMGQGEILATPLQMALTACAVANDGIIMKPYIVDRAENKNGVSVISAKQKQQSIAMSPENAEYIKQMMVDTVKNGTGTSARINGITVAGKTGTAENEESVKQKNKEHTWFVAFAPAEDPQIAVAVMLEYSGGYGSSQCGPIVRGIINKYLK